LGVVADLLAHNLSVSGIPPRESLSPAKSKPFFAGR
jgi:hypothetical protein